MLDQNILNDIESGVKRSQPGYNLENLLSREMIDFQKDTKIVQELTDILQEARNMKNIDWKKMDNRQLGDTDKKIAAALTKRFGYNFKTVTSHSHGEKQEFPNASMVTPTPSGAHDVGRGRGSRNTEVSIDYAVNPNNATGAELLAKMKEEEKEGNSIADIDQETINKAWNDSCKAVEQAFYTKNVKIDRAKAKITGLPKDYSVILEINLSYMLHNNEFVTSVSPDGYLPIDALVAIIMHEVGHSFTILESTYTEYHNTRILLDTFKDNMSRGMNYKQSFCLAYKTATGEDPTNAVKDLGDEATAVYLIDKYVCGEERFLCAYANIDCEALADQFASRFGCGVGLMKFQKLINEYYYNAAGLSDKFYIFQWEGGQDMWTNAQRGIYGAMAYNILNLIAFAAIAPIASPVVLPAFIASSLAGVLGCVNKVSRGYKLVNNLASSYIYDSKYDDRLRRSERIRNDEVARLRNKAYSSPEERDDIVSHIARMDELLKNSKRYDPNLLAKIFLFFSSNRKELDIRKLQYLQEDLNNNNLYTQAARLKSIASKTSTDVTKESVRESNHILLPSQEGFFGGLFGGNKDTKKKTSDQLESSLPSIMRME